MNSAEPRVLTVGEAMLVIASDPPAPVESARAFRLALAGAEVNVAVGLAHRGISAEWAGAVGNDAIGRRVLREIAKTGVKTGRATVIDDAPTGIYVKDPAGPPIYYRRSSAMTRLSAQFARQLPLDRVEWVHLSGITPALSSGCADLVDAIISRRATEHLPVSFDVNHRASLWHTDEAPHTLLRIARRCDLVFVGMDEANTLWGTGSPAEVRQLLPEPELVVKDAERGATLFGPAGETFEPALRVEVVESVGAGDAFAAGYLAATLNGASVANRLRAAHRAAAHALTTTADH